MNQLTAVRIERLGGHQSRICVNQLTAVSVPEAARAETMLLEDFCFRRLLLAGTGGLTGLVAAAEMLALWGF